MSTWATVGKALTAARLALVLTRAMIGARLFPRTSAETTAAVTPADEGFSVGDLYRQGAVGDGVTDDSVGIAAASAAALAGDGVMILQAGQFLQPGAALALAGVHVRGVRGAVFVGDLAQDTFKVDGVVRIDGVQFDTHRYALQNQNYADPAVDLELTGCEFRNGASIPVWVQAPLNRAIVTNCHFHDGEGQQLRFGGNVYANQAGWEGALAAFNLFRDITSSSTAQSTAAVLSYAPFGKIIGNHAADIVGNAGNETWFYYVKSPHGIVALNTGRNLATASAGTLYGINLKGTSRGDTSSPEGYGALALGNQLVGGGEGTAVQMEAEEQAVIACSFENFPQGVEEGTSDLSGNRLIGNRLRGTAAASTRAHGATASGARHLSTANIFQGFESGFVFATASSNTFDRVMRFGEMFQGNSNAAGRAMDVVANVAGNITNVMLSALHGRSFAQGIRVRGVTDGLLRDIVLDDIGAGTSLADFTDSHRLRGREVFPFNVSTSDATPTAIWRAPLYSAGQRMRVLMRALVKQGAVGATGTDEAWITKECIAKNEAGTVTILESGASAKIGSATGKTADLAFAINGTTVECRVVGIAATAMSWMGSFDFDLL